MQLDEKNDIPKQKKSMGGKAKPVLLSALLVFLCVVGGFLGAFLEGKFDQATTNSNIPDGNAIVTKEEKDITDVVEKVSPSVVSIVTSRTKTSIFEGARQYVGAGTGMIVSQDGFILTNKHVIDGADTVQVILSDGTVYEGVRIVGVDPLNDMAFLKIDDVKNLPKVELGDSKTVRIGQKVVAIGNALGQYQNTVTSGIISGTGRPVVASTASGPAESLTDLIQTDTAINEGNSGGPLLNLLGQVVGINTAIAADAQGIGFAIPIGAAKGILKGVLAGKGVEHPNLGVRYVSVTPDVAKEYNLSVKQGSYLLSEDGSSAVLKDSPADKAGLKDKDIITKVGNSLVGDSGSVSSLVAEYQAGETVKLTVVRDGKTMEFDVKLGVFRK